jgi:hypothetical protein
MQCKYRPFGRGQNGFDCWGLVRHILHHHYDIPLLNDFGRLKTDDQFAINNALLDLTPLFKQSPAADGAVAGCYRGSHLSHVGICIDLNAEFYVLHITSDLGIALMRINDFKRLFTKVVFYLYDNSNHQSIPKQI